MANMAQTTTLAPLHLAVVSLFLLATAAAATRSPGCGFAPTTNTECWGLQAAPAASSAAACEAACCASASCRIWNFCPANETCHAEQGGCWLGASSSHCASVGGWVGGQRTAAPGQLLTLTLPTSLPAPTPLAVNRSVAGARSIDSLSWTVNNGQRWFPISGEIHYARVPAAQWRATLLKMKAGGLNMVQAYAFWIHHEEVQGQFDWSERRNLTAFLQLCRELRLPVLLRMGPFDHGECRNGGLPDWLMALQDKIKLRSTDPKFLNLARLFYRQLSAQLRGLIYGPDNEDGPVFAAQVDNETSDVEYLQALRQVAMEEGIAVPFFCKTGWPAPNAPVANGTLIPFFGGYAAEFWSDSMEPDYNQDQYIFSTSRPQPDGYPQLLVELGGGMETSYHRRIRIESHSISTFSMMKLASGANQLGYYMYKGGTNPQGKLTDQMEESQDDPMKQPNDMPYKSYDFYAPVGEFEQTRQHYHDLRRMHLFLQAYGEWLVPMVPALPDIQPTSSSDNTTLRWAARSDGQGGLIFVNNYARLNDQLGPKEYARFALAAKDGSTLRVPLAASPNVTVPANATFMWAFNLPTPANITLRYALAQPVTVLESAGTTTLVFSQIAGVAPEFVFVAAAGLAVANTTGTVTHEDGCVVVRAAPAGVVPVVVLTTPAGGRLAVVLVDDTPGSDTQMFRGRVGGMERLVVVRGGADIMFGESEDEGDDVAGSLQLQTQANSLELGILPPVQQLTAPAQGSVTPQPAPAGSAFSVFKLDFAAPAAKVAVAVESVRPAAPARKVPIGPAGRAHNPTDDVWQAEAALYTLTVTGANAAGTQPVRLAVDYTGDCARLVNASSGELLTDNYYNGRVFEIGLEHFLPGGLPPTLQLGLQLMPLRHDAPIYLPQWPAFPVGNISVLALNHVDAVALHDIVLGVH